MRAWIPAAITTLATVLAPESGSAQALGFMEYSPIAYYTEEDHRIADEAGLGTGFVGLSMVAAGTSAPELVTAVVAVRGGHSELVLGNVLGSNMLNSLGGGAVMVARLGLRLGRGARICPERVLFAYCAVYLLSSAAADADRDPLPLAPAMALVAALGARAALVTTFGLLARLRAAPDRSPT